MGELQRVFFSGWFVSMVFRKNGFVEGERENGVASGNRDTDRPRRVGTWRNEGMGSRECRIEAHRWQIHSHPHAYSTYSTEPPEGIFRGIIGDLSHRHACCLIMNSYEQL
jgi:hypothetical protein